MASMEDERAANQLTAHLSPKEIAIRAGTNEAAAVAVMRVVMNRVDQRMKSISAAQGRFRRMTEAVLSIAHDANISQLAIDNSVPENEVDRMIKVVTTIANTASSRVKRDANLQSFFAPLRVIRDGSVMQWPESIPEHASRLRQAFDRFPLNRELSEHTSVLISLQDLQASMALLDQKITSAYGQWLDSIPPQQRPEFATEAWYTSRSQQHEAMTKSTRNSLSAKDADMALVKGGKVHSEAAKMQYLGEGGHSASPMFPTSATLSGLPLHSPHTISSSSRAMIPYAGPGMSRSHVAMQLPTPKHDLPRSPNQSPIKKKSKDGPGPRKPQASLGSTQLDGAYIFFVLAEREQIQKDVNKIYPKNKEIRGSELNNLLSELWTRMSAEEKAPFVTVHERWQEQEKENAKVLAVASSQRTIEESVRAVNRKKLVEGLERCKTVLDARTVWEQLRSKRTASPANHITRKAARASTAPQPRLQQPPPPPHVPLRALPAPGPTTGMMAAPRAVPQIPRQPPAPPAQQPGRHSPLQARQPSLAPQPPQRTITPNRLLSNAELLVQMKQTNASLKEIMARSMTPDNFVDLTENDTLHSSPPQNGDQSFVRVAEKDERDIVDEGTGAQAGPEEL